MYDVSLHDWGVIIIIFSTSKSTIKSSGDVTCYLEPDDHTSEGVY